MIDRINQCETVVNHLDECQAWKIISTDLVVQKQLLDDNWQDITDEKKLQKARELKHAYMHLILLKDKYKQDLDEARKELDKIQSPEEKMVKDYDTETQVEG